MLLMASLTRLADMPPERLIIAAVSRQPESLVELLLILGFLLFVYMLGEHAGRESPSRSKQLQEIVKQEAELKNLKTGLNSTTTSPWMHLVVILILVYVVLQMLSGGFRDDDGRDRRRFR